MAFWAIINRARIQVEFSGSPKVGGEGEVYQILNPAYVDYCAKIYHEDHITKELIEKLEYMVSHKIAVSSEEIRVCWPEALLYDDEGHFRGFIMRRAFEGSRDLEILQDNGNLTTIEEEYPKWKDWFRYDFAEEDSLRLRMLLLYNVANAIRIIHQNKRVVIHDFKPANVLATAEGKVSIVDVDSFQIQTEQGVFYRGATFTPDYFPKNAYQQESKHIAVDQTCDTFAYAVMAYNTLIGVHPYSGFIRKKPYDGETYSTLEACIKNDLSPYGRNKKYVKPLDPEIDCHSRFKSLDSRLASIFLKAFDSTKKGTVITEWIDAFSSVLFPERIIPEGVFSEEGGYSRKAIAESFFTISFWPSLLLGIQMIIIMYLLFGQLIGAPSVQALSHTRTIMIAESVFVALFLFLAIMIIRGFIILHSKDEPLSVYVPLYNDANISAHSFSLLSLIKQNGCAKASIDAINVVVYDYLRELQANSIAEVDKYLPTFGQFKVFPIESLKLMLSSERELNELGCENRFYSLKDIVSQCEVYLTNCSNK